MRAAILLLAATVALTGCELQDVLSATKTVPGKIDDTNNEVKKTNAEVKKTNDKMDIMVDEVKETNAGMDTMIDEVRETNDGMVDMNNEVKRTNRGMDDMIKEVRATNRAIETTNHAVHKQAMAQAMEVMFKTENTHFEDPVTAMMPAGKALALEATSQELVELVATFLSEINTAMPPETARGEGGSWTKATVDSYDHGKKVKFLAAMIVSGLAPQKTIAEMIVDQIEEGGRFEAEAYNVLMLRYAFIHDYLYKNSIVDKGKLRNPGGIEDAIEYAEHLDDITSLPYSKGISVTITGMLNPERNFALEMDAGQTRAAWERLQKAFEIDLDEKYKSPDHPRASTIRSLKERVDKHL